MKNISIIGDGGWGTALGLVLHHNKHNVTIWGPFPDYIEQTRTSGENKTFLPGIKLPPEINWTSDRAQAVANADAIVIAVPSKYYRDVLTSFAPHIPSSVSPIQTSNFPLQTSSRPPTDHRSLVTDNSSSPTGNSATGHPSSLHYAVASRSLSSSSPTGHRSPVTGHSSSPLLVSVTKGIDKQTSNRMTQLAQSLLNRDHVAALSGPSHAEEVARGIPTAVAIACDQIVIAEQLQAIFAQDVFRVYTTDDTIGVELGGAVKNIIAIAAGICDGIGYGDNTKAALMTRGLAEISRLGAALGAHPETFAGLSGMGDLIVTCGSRHSRNRGVGERLGKGESIDDILNSMAQVAEGVPTAASAKALADKLNISMPITEQVYEILYNHKDPKQAVQSLLTRTPKPEVY